MLVSAGRDTAESWFFRCIVVGLLTLFSREAGSDGDVNLDLGCLLTLSVGVISAPIGILCSELLFAYELIVNY